VSDQPPLRVAVAGASGRMGQMLIEAVNSADDCALAAQLDIGCDIDTALQGAQVLIDFTRPEGTMAHLRACRGRSVNLVIGTTGFDETQLAAITEHANHIGIVTSANFSVGVNVMLTLLRQAARALSEGYDIEIVEAHHRHKVDAPSGTAVEMGRVLAQAQGRTLKDCAVFSREGHTGERKAGSIGFATVRGGGIVGDHTAMFCGDVDRIEITHKSASRGIYAQGALRAARFVAQQRKGLFGMNDVLGFTA
jgi:4-hydroxy-tetrahydrodipicolinate reductase